MKINLNKEPPVVHVDINKKKKELENIVNVKVDLKKKKLEI